jgi:hypothetical protein
VAATFATAALAAAVLTPAAQGAPTVLWLGGTWQ